MLARPRPTNVVTELADEVIRLQGRLKSVFAGVVEEMGLTVTESTVLAAVIEAQSAPTVPQIGRSLGHPRQVIQRAVNVLTDKGLVRTEANPNHVRAPLLLPTGRGRALRDAAGDRANQAVKALLETVEPAACKRLTRELRQLRHAI